MKILLQLLFIFLSSIAYSQGTNCADADPFCSDTAEIFPNTTGVANAEPGPDYGCLGSTPNPAWYYMQVGNAGDINLTISQESAGGNGLDVDFICWGPFAELAGSCNALTAANEIDCSYSLAAVENCNIPSAQVGEYYIVLITNFSGISGTINFQQTSGAGQTDCTILLPCFADAGSDDSFCAGGTANLGGAPTAVGGSNIFTYSWSPTSGLNDATITNPTATPSSTTTYTVTVDDGAGCIQTDEVTVTILDDPTVSPGPDQELTCLADQVELDASSSTLGTYTWSTLDGNIVSGGTADIAVVDAPGTYTLEIISGDDCVAESDVMVSLGDLTASATITGPTDLCEGEVGDFTIDIDQLGNWSIEYSIDGLAQNTIDLEGVQFIFSSGQEGVHEINLISNPLCTVDIGDPVELQIEELPSVLFPSDDVNLCPGETETVEIELTGEGDITFSYEYDFVEQAPVTSQAGFYSIDISENGGFSPIGVSTDNCIGSVAGFFNAFDQPFPTAVFQDDYTICQGEIAQVAIEFSGNAPYQFEYSIDGVPQGVEISPTDLVILPIENAMTIDLLTLDDLYCIGSPESSSLVSVNPLPTAIINGGDIFCSNELVELSIELIGTAPFTVSYSIDGAPQTDIETNDLQYVLETMEDGTYEITSIVDGLCNDGIQNNTTIVHYPLIDVDLIYDTEVCEDDTVSITAMASGGQSNGYSFLWTDLNDQTFTDNPLTLAFQEDQNIELVVNDGCDIPNTDGLVIMDVQAFPDPSFTTMDDSLCIGEQAEFIRDAVDESVTCLWTFDDGSVLSDCDGISFAFFGSGYQSVELSSSTSAGCSNTFKQDSALYVVPDAIASFEAIADQGTIFDPEIIFINESENAAEYLWDFGDGEVSREESPIHYYPSAVSGFYPACLAAYNYLGCVDTTCYLIEIEPEFLLSAPTAFTPDDDGLNDYFVPVFNDIKLAEYSLQIFDRFGAIVFESKDQFERWNGGGSAESNYYSADAVYFYRVVTREMNRSEKREFFGQLTLIR